MWLSVCDYLFVWFVYFVYCVIELGGLCCMLWFGSGGVFELMFVVVLFEWFVLFVVLFCVGWCMLLWFFLCSVWVWVFDGEVKVVSVWINEWVVSEVDDLVIVIVWCGVYLLFDELFGMFVWFVFELFVEYLKEVV